MDLDTCDFDLTDAELRAAGTVKWTLPPEGVLAAWVAEMDVRPCPAVLAAVRDAVDRGCFGYNPLDSYTGLPGATAAFLSARFGWEVDADQVLGCGDVMAGVGLALDHLCAPGAVVVPVPSYPPLLGIVPLSGRELVTVPCASESGRPTLDLEAIDAALAAGASTVLLTSPHNPLGRAFTVPELLGLRDVVARRGARVISDEIHAPLVLPGAVHTPYASLPGTAEHTTTVVAASKAWNLPGLKSAQVVTGTLEDAVLLRGLPYVANHGASPLGVIATIAAYTHGVGWLDSVLAHLDARRAQFAARMAADLPHLPFPLPEATYLAWVDARPTGLADPVQAARDAGVELTAGKDFGAGFECFGRVNFATSAERLDRVMDRLAAAWAS